MHFDFFFTGDSGWKTNPEVEIDLCGGFRIN